ncbi:ImmA/IrrE family metallo-endopeptidase [Kitasatospora sp. NPDC058478]|uniref:ImmA/IrrE family metallo-endopeptidase n=1 Tax=unclassified Kitasatospora TaxID=2633591 RepID=UPI00365A9FD7
MPVPRAVRKRCDTLLSTLPIPEPFSAEAFAEALAEQRGRPIVIRPLPPGPGGPDTLSGLWVPLPSVDAVFYDASTSLAHQTLTKLHELGHIAFGHQSQINPAAIAQAFPDMDERHAAKVLGLPRASLSEVQEQEAEMLALLLASRLGSGRGTTPQGQALTATLGHPVRPAVEGRRSI